MNKSILVIGLAIAISGCSTPKKTPLNEDENRLVISSDILTDNYTHLPSVSYSGMLTTSFETTLDPREITKLNIILPGEDGKACTTNAVITKIDVSTKRLFAQTFDLTCGDRSFVFDSHIYDQNRLAGLPIQVEHISNIQTHPKIKLEPNQIVTLVTD